MASIDLARYEEEDDYEEEEEEGFERQRYDDDSDDGGDAALAAVSATAALPTELKALRACMVCTLVKTYGQFLDEGCDNCEAFLQMAERQDRVAQLTSPSFEGMAAVMRPGDSWVAKYQGIHKMKPGVYALEVTGTLNPEFEDFLREKNIPYRAKAPAAAQR